MCIRDREDESGVADHLRSIDRLMDDTLAEVEQRMEHGCNGLSLIHISVIRTSCSLLFQAICVLSARIPAGADDLCFKKNVPGRSQLRDCLLYTSQTVYIIHEQLFDCAGAFILNDTEGQLFKPFLKCRSQTEQRCV